MRWELIVLTCVRKAAIEDINALFSELDADAIRMQPTKFQKGSRSVEYLSGLIADEKSEECVV